MTAGRRAALLLLGAIAALAMPATASARESCDEWRAPTTLPEFQPLRLLGSIALPRTRTVRLRADIIDGGKRMEGDLKWTSDEAIRAALFDSPDRALHLVLADDGAPAFIRTDTGDMEDVDGGIVLGGVDLPAPDRNPRICYRRPGVPVLLSEAEIVDEDYVYRPARDRESRRPPDRRPPEVPKVDKPPSLSEVLADLGGTGTDKPKPPPERPGLGDIAKDASDKAKSPPTPPEEPVADPKPVVEPPPDDPTRDAILEAAPDLRRVCLASQTAPFALDGGATEGDFFAAGRLRIGKEVRGYRQIFDVVEPLPGRYRFDEGARQPALTVLSIPNGLRVLPVPREAGDDSPSQVQLFRPVAHDPVAAKAPKVVAAPSDAPELARVLIIGDAATVAISGLDALDRALIESAGRGAVRYSWARVAGDGQVGAPAAFADSAALLAAATADNTSWFATEDDTFDLLMDGMTAAMTGDGPPFDMVIWVIEGHVLPHSAPARFAAFIREVEASGRIARFPSGAARKWLQVVAGRFSTTYAQSYLEGPLLSIGARGSLTVESRADDGQPRALMRNFVNLFDSLKVIVARHKSEMGIARPVAAAEPAPEGDIYFSRGEALEDIGLLVRADALQDLLQSLFLTQSLLLDRPMPAPEHELADSLGLIRLSTDTDGRIESGALSEAQIGLRMRALQSRTDADVAERVKSWLQVVVYDSYQLSRRDDCEFIFLSVDSIYLN